MCTQEIIIEPVMVCNDEVNITLGANCAVEITADMILEGQCADDEDYVVTITGDTDNIIEAPGSYYVRVEYAPQTGSGTLFTGLYCWGTINAEDKTGPTCTLEKDCYTAFCGSDFETDVPVFSDCTGLVNDTVRFDQTYGSCGEYDDTPIDWLVDANGNGFIDVFEPDNIFIPLPCEIPGAGFSLDNVVVRTWQMSDVLGNGSVSCRAYIYFWRPSTIFAPIPSIELECLADLTADDLAAANPRYVPHFTNPAFLTDPTAPEFLPLIEGSHSACKYSVTFNDVPLLDLCGNTQKFIREWTILDWCDGGIVNATKIDVDGNVDAAMPTVLMNQYPQIVKTVDTVAPEWMVCPDTTVVGGAANKPIVLNSSSSSEGACFYVGVLPQPLATDDCGTITYTAEVKNLNGAVLYAVDDLAQPTQLDFGVHEVCYIATDACGNISRCSYFYEVIDDDKPVAICDEFTTISLTNAVNGGARICAEHLDSGSYDNCGIADRKVKRMSDDEAVPFSECIDLTCEDAANSPIMVRMRVYDAAGNFNECMVEVEIQDKIGPFLTCPPDITITCTDDLYDLSLTGNVIQGTSAPNAQDGYAWDNCDGTLDISYATNVGELACGAGVATRTWTANSNGSTETCVQTITISSINSFRVEFPKDTLITTCVDPNNLGNFGEPIITNDICAQVGVAHTDTQFDIVEGACYKILRTWTVINWCNYDDTNLGNTALGNLVAGTQCTYDDDGDGYFRFTQVIKVQDEVDPVFVNCPNGVVTFPSLPDNCGGYANLKADAVDACTNTIAYQYFIDINDDDSAFEYSGTGNIVNDGTIYPAGTHRVVFIAEDGCGNTARCEYNFKIGDDQAPTVACKGLSVTLMPSSNSIEMWASDYIKEESAPTDNCTASDELIITVIRQSDSNQTTPPSSTNITFDCTDLQLDVDNDGDIDTVNQNTIPVEIWVGDGNGNWAFCTANTLVTSNNSGCFVGTGLNTGTTGDGNNDAKATIAGYLADETGSELEEVNIEVNSDQSLWGYTTGTDGYYNISDLPMHDNYTVRPTNDNDPLNGVSTYDLVLMSQHILGMEALDTPYKLIAADVNNDGKITTFDIVQTRQLILYIVTDFPTNTSWRFVDASFVFPDPTDPFASVFPEVRSVNDLEEDEMTENFVGIKIADVNGDAIANSLLGAEERNEVGTLTFAANDQLVAKGETVSLQLTASDLANVSGFQFTLDFDNDALEFVEVGQSDLEGMSGANFGYTFVNEGMLTASWNKVAEVSKANNVVELKFTAKQDVQLSEAIGINSRYTKAEAYDATMNNMGLALQFNTSNGTILADASFELYQNQPNPFSNETSIGFVLPEAANVTLTVFDVEGQQLKVYTNDYAKGYNQITIGNDDLTSGILYYRLDTPTHTATKKMIVIK